MSVRHEYPRATGALAFTIGAWGAWLIWTRDRNLPWRSSSLAFAGLVVACLFGFGMMTLGKRWWSLFPENEEPDGSIHPRSLRLYLAGTFLMFAVAGVAEIWGLP